MTSPGSQDDERPAPAGENAPGGRPERGHTPHAGGSGTVPDPGRPVPSHQSTHSFPPAGPRPVTPAPPAPVPADLTDHPRYQVLEFLGAGGMGTVYKARHRLMDRVVALKFINPHLVTKPTMADRFRREVTAAARLNHPNIVAAFDADRAGDTHFLVMEFV